MLLVAFAVLLLSGGVQVMPTFDQNLDVSCCIMYWEASKATTGSVEVKKDATSWAVSAKVRERF